MSSADLLTLTLVAVDGRKVWPHFAPHHYLTTKYNGHRAYLALLPDGTPVAFTSAIAQPSGHFRNGWRGHRTVVLPDFQGLGLGARLSDWLGQHVVNAGGRFFSRTTHPRLGAYREASPLWRPTSHNRKAMKGSEASRKGWGDPNRVCFAHEYVGLPRESMDTERTAEAS